jgi:RND family efflux transporter MFP subunit
MKWVTAALSCTVALSLAACGRKASETAASAPAAVTVTRPVAREVNDWDEYAGRLQSPEIANVTARVSGFIEEVQFKEGALVKKGDLLVVIDDRPFRAELENRRAAVQKDEADLKLMQQDLERSTDLLKRRVVAQQDFDTNKARAAQSAAQLAADKAAEETARLNLEWTHVTAPISGRISRINVTAGNQVSGIAGQATLLTTIVSIDPMYCYVAVPGRTYLEYQKFAEREKARDVRRTKIPCYVGLEIESGFPHEGTVDFIDNAVDPNTGTIQMRGVIPNPHGFLTPGVFARMRIAHGDPYKTLLVPDKALGSEQNERTLLIVGKENVVESRRVKVGALFGSLRSITSGLDPNDRVIVAGLQKAQAGQKVTPQEEPISPEALKAVDSLAQGAGGSKSAAE